MISYKRVGKTWVLAWPRYGLHLGSAHWWKPIASLPRALAGYAMWRPSSVTIEFLHGNGDDEVTDVQVTCNFPAQHTVIDKRAVMTHQESLGLNETLNIRMGGAPSPGTLTTLADDPLSDTQKVKR